MTGKQVGSGRVWSTRFGKKQGYSLQAGGRFAVPGCSQVF